MTVEWRKVDVFPESELTWEASEASWDEGEHFCSALRVTFRGVYRPGSAGSPDAGLMMAVTGAALARDWPDVVIFDFTELDYKWGDGLLGIFEVVGARDRDHPIACVVVAGPESAPAVKSLLGGGSDWLFDSVEAAWPKVVELAVERSKAIG
jgi:hypothetical protein